MSQVIAIGGAEALREGCWVCGAHVWDCTVDGCKPGVRNLDGDVIHCKICNSVYIVQRERVMGAGAHGGRS